MNKLMIIGNLTRDPELRVTPSGIQVCSFSVAVNRRRKDGQDPETDFFNVTVWRQLGEICSRYLFKGRKVCVTGPVTLQTYTGADGKQRASMNVTAEDVEFLSPRADTVEKTEPAKKAPEIPEGFVQVEDGELPF